VNVATASTTPPAIKPIQLELFPGRACVPKAKPATDRSPAINTPKRRDGVLDGSTQRQTIELTGETLFGPAEETPSGREAYKGRTRKRGNEAGQGVGGGHSIKRTKQGKAAGLHPRLVKIPYVSAIIRHHYGIAHTVQRCAEELVRYENILAQWLICVHLDY
jgi:hypothetical protein